MIVRIVRFRSRLSEEDVLSTYQDRAARYRKVPGLRQKYYLRFPETGEYGAVYVWDSPEALRRFNDSDLARTIPDAYQVEGAPKAESAEVVFALHPKG
jgi:heme-degrading monooxygenase HmoA